jgi:hypothetical protein
MLSVFLRFLEWQLSQREHQMKSAIDAGDTFQM